MTHEGTKDKQRRLVASVRTYGTWKTGYASTHQWIIKGKVRQTGTKPYDYGKKQGGNRTGGNGDEGYLVDSHKN